MFRTEDLMNNEITWLMLDNMDIDFLGDSQWSGQN